MHPKIMMAAEDYYARKELAPIIDRLAHACERNDHDAIVTI
ncbi:hypothetical protein [Ralstonia soli]|nr:hypothetical protein [Ralstonia soli]